MMMRIQVIGVIAFAIIDYFVDNIVIIVGIFVILAIVE